MAPEFRDVGATLKHSQVCRSNEKENTRNFKSDAWLRLRLKALEAEGSATGVRREIYHVTDNLFAA